MAKVRKDLRGRTLRKGEVQRSSDKRYMYTYTDPMGRRKFIYANDLAELREKESKLMKDQLDGLDLYVAGKASVNDTFDRYMSTKYNLRESTKSSYLYTYDHYVRDTFGKKRIADIKYSDVLQFYYYLLNEVKISLGTLDTIHCLLHPTFQLAVRDEIIRNYDLCIWYSDCGIYKLADKCIAWLRYVFKTDTWSCDWKLMYCRLWWTDQ